MENRLLHTPEGVRDIYDTECEKRLVLQEKLQNVLKRYGYHAIQTPTFEFFDIFSREIGTTPSRNLYKFFDREGNTLVLRPDMTPSVARCAAKYYMNEELPLRFCYSGNTFINSSSYRGRLKETTQIGAELIGDGTVAADGEMIALVIDCMLESGLREFQVSIGQVAFFKSLIAQARMEGETEHTLRKMISNKNFFGVEELLMEKNIAQNLKEAFLRLPRLFGGAAVLDEAAMLTENQEALAAVERLRDILRVLSCYGLEKYVSFDLGMLSKYRYYTGVIFKAYTYGTGEPLVTGGRYDTLLGQFGKQSPSTGFTIMLDDLMNVLARQNIAIPLSHTNTMILYEEALTELAVKLAVSYRRSGMNVELMLKAADKSFSDYREFGKRSHLGGILYLENEERAQLADLAAETVRVVDLAEIMAGRQT